MGIRPHKHGSGPTRLAYTGRGDEVFEEGWSENQEGAEDVKPFVTEPLVLAAGTDGTVLEGKVVGRKAIAWSASVHVPKGRLLGVTAVPGKNLVVAVGDDGTVVLGTMDGTGITAWRAPAQVEKGEGLYGASSLSVHQRGDQGLPAVEVPQATAGVPSRPRCASGQAQKSAGP